MRPLERKKEGPGQNPEHQLSGNGQKGRSLSAASKVQNGLEVTDAKENVIFKAEGGHQGQMLLRSHISREMESDCDRSSANGMWPLSTVDEAESLQEKQGHFKAIKLLAGTLARAQEAAQPTAMHI